MKTENQIDISKADLAQAELTEIITTEVSLVDRAANRREFLVKKRADNEAPVINPLLAPDAEMIAQDKKDAEDYKAQKAAEEMGTTTVAVVETPVVETAPAVEPVVAKVETPAAETVTVAAVEAPVAAPAPTPEPVVEPAVAKVEAPLPTVEARKDDGSEPSVVLAVQMMPPPPEALKVRPAIKAALEAGLAAIVARVYDAQKILSAAVVDPAGYSYTPFEVVAQIHQIDALVDRMECLGGDDWEADAILSAGAASVGTDVNKAGAPMSAVRHNSFSKTHGDMGSALKNMTKCYKAMGDMLDKVAPRVKTEKSDDSVAVTLDPTPAPAPAPITAPVAAPAAPAAPTAPTAPAAAITKSDTSETVVLTKAVEDLRRLVVSQAAILEKAKLPRDSNAIPLAHSMPNNGTINAGETVWPADLAAMSTKKAGRF